MNLIQANDNSTGHKLPGVRPVGFHILGQLSEGANREKAHTMLPDDAFEYPCMLVLAIGKDVTLFKVGDKVLVRQEHIQGLRQGDLRFCFLEDKVFAVME